MILLCDEDIGTGIPQALELVGFEAMSLAKRGWLSTPDVQWLTHAGRQVWIVLSCNKKMLDVPQERDTIVRERVGIVFLTSGEENLPKTLRLPLGKMDWFETIDVLVPRPFAYYLYPRGRTDKKLDYSRTVHCQRREDLSYHALAAALKEGQVSRGASSI